MADDGISAANEHDVRSATTDTDHLQTTGDGSVPPAVSVDCCAATSGSDVAHPSMVAETMVAETSENNGTPAGIDPAESDPAESDTPPAVQTPLLSVDDALRSIARPTPINIVAPVTRAVEAVTSGCRRLTPILLPRGLTHALAIAIGCAIGWHTRNGDDVVPVVTAGAGTSAISDRASDVVGSGSVDALAFDALAFDAIDNAIFDTAHSQPAPFSPVESARPIEVNEASSPLLGGAHSVAAAPAHVESRFTAPGMFVPSPEVTPEAVAQRLAAAQQLATAQRLAVAQRLATAVAPQPIEIPNDAVSLDTAGSTTAAPTVVVPATAVSASASPVAASPATATAAALANTTAGVMVATAIPVVGVMTYTADDLARALDDAHEATGCSHCQSTGRQVAAEHDATNGQPQLASRTSGDGAKTCSACGGMPAARFTSEGYESLCRLAEVATFVRVEADDTATWSIRDQSRQLLSVAIGKRDRLNKTGRLAGFRLDDPARPDNGVLLAGTVQRVIYLGSLYHSEIVLFGVPRRVTVVSEREPPFGEGDRVVVLGAIVDRPVENLRGYQGEVQQVVWGGLPLVLSE